jgi:hypothetical protein
MTCPGGKPLVWQHSNSGTSVAALVGGIVGTAAGILLLLGLLFFTALKKNWIVTGNKYRRCIIERATTEETGEFLPNRSQHIPELNIAQIGGDPVYQMP